MWKIFVGFIIFAALTVFILQKSGGNVDMGGERHDAAPDASAAHGAASAATAAAASSASPAASAASR